jgi:glycosyltransferase A (GT-A) superfamily protein (DUF2064 family)
LRRYARTAGWRLARARRCATGWRRELRRGRGPIVLIGGDVPGSAVLAALDTAFAALARQDLVLGPTEDGGSWLIGLARRRRTPSSLPARAQRRGVDDTIAAILAQVPMRLWQVELLAIEDLPRLCLGPPTR